MSSRWSAQLGGSSPEPLRWRVRRECAGLARPCNLLMTARGIVTLQLVRREHLGWHLRVPGGRPLKRTPGPVDALPLVPCRTEPVLKIRAVGLTVVNGKWSCDYTDQGMAARQRALDRGYRGSRPPQPRDQSLRVQFQNAIVPDRKAQGLELRLSGPTWLADRATTSM